MASKRAFLRPQALAWSTLAGVVVYVAIDVLLKFLRPAYSLVYNAESDYGRGPWYWVMDINFLLRCAFSLSLVVAVSRTTFRSPLLRAGLALLAVWAVASGLLAFFADDIEGQPVHGSGVVHLGLAFIAFVAVTIGTVVLSAAMRTSPAWAPVSGALLVLSLFGVVAFLLLGGALHGKHGPDGLYERIFLGIELLWMAGAAAFIAARTGVPARQLVAEG